LTYGPTESLAYFMFQKPRAAKRLYFDVIPRAVDDYLSHLQAYDAEDERRLENPVWHIHDGNPPQAGPKLSFGMLLNLASVCNTEDKAVLWGFISRYAPQATPESDPFLDRLVGFALRYYADFVKPKKSYRAPTPAECAALTDLAARLKQLAKDADGEAIQNEVYAVGKAHGYENLRDWFKALYEILLGQQEGPRMGSFMALYGLEESIALIDGALQG